MTKRGEEPPDHTHPTEDELFIVMSGSITFRCAGREFDVTDGAFVYLLKGIMRGYTVKHDGPVRLLAITFPAALPQTKVEAAPSLI